MPTRSATFIQTKAYPRAALIGNPSDGYNGKTIAFTFKNFEARVTLRRNTAALQFVCPREADYASVADFIARTKSHSYYGSSRLLKAALMQFYEYCAARHLLDEAALRRAAFRVEVETNVPSRVGLAGSSAIVVAALRAYMQYFDIEIPPT